MKIFDFLTGSIGSGISIVSLSNFTEFHRNLYDDLFLILCIFLSGCISTLFGNIYREWRENRKREKFRKK